MNIPKEMEENGYKRRDLYNVYTHFLSIYRLQQSMRKDFCKDDKKKINEFDSVDYDLFLDNTPIIKYENKEMAERI